ncbi:hypothetical protein Ocin01_16832 [Orchesella cincta]|uniref:Uncharacterized protein n=1 Tax=Orchesella cincta TaxID=48709 RepID=A0A1D2MA55_ORCCI|nr:hypothetical protein Ocin01_16832 [Orchesella cincta]
MSSHKKSTESEARVEKEADQRGRRTLSLPRPKSPSREVTSSTNTASTSNSSRHLLVNSIPGPLVQRVPLAALLPVPVSLHQQSNISYSRASLQNQPDLVNFHSSASIRTGNYRGFNSATSQLLVFSCVTNRPFSVHLTSDRLSMTSSNSRPGFNVGNMGLPQDIPNGYLSQDQSRRQTEFLGNQQVQRMHGDQSAGGGGAAPSISHHHGTSFNFYFVNSGNYGLNFSGNGLPTPTQQHQPQPPYQGYTGPSGPSGMFGSNPFPAHSSQNSSLVGHRDSSLTPDYSSFHSNPFPTPPYQRGCNHPHHQQFGQGQPPLAIQPQGTGHCGGNFQPIPDGYSDHRASNVPFNTARPLSQSTLDDGSLYGDENDVENASQQSQGQRNHGGMYGPCSQHGYYK